MIISKDIHPTKNLYYVGAKIIQILQKNDSKDIDIIEIYEEYNKLEKITMSLLLLGFDWLYLLNLVSIDNGRLSLCS